MVTCGENRTGRVERDRLTAGGADVYSQKTHDDILADGCVCSNKDEKEKKRKKVDNDSQSHYINYEHMLKTFSERR